MPGFMPGIHVFFISEDVDGRVKPGHDERFIFCLEKADIHDPNRYINPARHVRAFGVAWESINDGIDTIERRA